MNQLHMGPASWQLWHIDLSAAATPTALSTLSPAEHARAARFVFDRDRRRYLTGRCALRTLLAQCTSTPAHALSIDVGPMGKPFLHPHRGWAFNLSHSDDTAVIALAPNPLGKIEIGIDIEALRPLHDTASLASAHFTPAELATLPEPGTAAHLSTFFLGWTRKEACLKAVGWGLNIEPSQVETQLTPASRTVTLLTGAQRLSVRVASAICPSLGVISWAEKLACSVSAESNSSSAYVS